VGGDVVIWKIVPVLVAAWFALVLVVLAALRRANQCDEAMSIDHEFNRLITRWDDEGDQP
jgi:hypothetical protein